MQLINSKECANYARQKWVKINDLESVYALFLNNDFEIECFKQINTSNYRETCFNAREAIKYAINLNFNYIILFHNHTSQLALPSETDKRLTRSLIGIFEAMNVHLVDHIILTVNDHYSFSDNNLLKTG